MSDGPEYNLYYFDARGLAEPIRLILAHSGAQWKDHRTPLESIPATVPAEIKESKLTTAQFLLHSEILTVVTIPKYENMCRVLVRSSATIGIRGRAPDTVPSYHPLPFPQVQPDGQR